VNYHQPLILINVLKSYDKSSFAEIMGFGQFDEAFKAFIWTKSFVTFSKSNLFFAIHNPFRFHNQIYLSENLIFRREIRVKMHVVRDLILSGAWKSAGLWKSKCYIPELQNFTNPLQFHYELLRVWKTCWTEFNNYPRENY